MICNPPYVRHHHLGIEKKQCLCNKMKSEYHMEFSKLSGLYCYFMALAAKWLSYNGIGIWLVPSEFLDVNYGSKVKEFLLTKVNLLRIHKFNQSDLKFGDALVSSAIVYYSKGKSENQFIDFTSGDDINKPTKSCRYKKSNLKPNDKWAALFDGKSCLCESGLKISDFFSVKRGIATGGNKYFILKKEQIEKLKIPDSCLRPILPSPRYLNRSVLRDESENEFYDYPIKS